MRRWLRVSLKIASLISVVNEPLIFSSAGGKIRKVYGHAAVWRSRRSRGCSRWQGKPRQVAHQEQGAAMLKSIAAIMAAAAIAAVLAVGPERSARSRPARKAGGGRVEGLHRTALALSQLRWHPVRKPAHPAGDGRPLIGGTNFPWR